MRLLKGRIARLETFVREKAETAGLLLLQCKLENVLDTCDKLEKLKLDYYATLDEKDLPNFEAEMDNLEESIEHIKVELLEVSRITDLIPSTPIKISEHLIPDRALLADPNFEIPRKINMTIGAELFYDILKEGKTRVSPNLLFQNSAFGLIATGKVHENHLNSFCGLTHTSENTEDSLQKFWEIESVSSDHFLKTHSRNECGRYVVQMPLKKDSQCLGDSKKLASKRLNNIYRKLDYNPELCNLYKDFMLEYQNSGHMQLVDTDINVNTSYYIPHLGVHRPDKTTSKLRVVFDASAQASSGESLYSIQMKGGVLQDDLFSIMCRFRKHHVAFTADIKGMFRTVLIDENQRDLPRIFWKWNKDEEAKIYKLLPMVLPLLHFWQRVS
ncbi:uncharacterized protein [Parasteatoda tepidariorum]|uniref:uncharacterized protein n=1 Tax=Parasteatoda tepidariorum TaxID=114398 RepID=UPI0039BD12DD